MDNNREGLPPPGMTATDVLLSMQAACRERRLIPYTLQDDTPLGPDATYAAFLVRALHAEAFPVPNAVFCTGNWLQSQIEQRYWRAVDHQDWPEAARWMCVQLPPTERERRRPQTEHPVELRTALPKAFAGALRFAFAYAVGPLRKRNWREARVRMEITARGALPFDDMALHRADLSDVDPHSRRTPLQDWERWVQPLLDREPSPSPEAHHQLMELGLRLRDATPLHPAVFHAALLATHPRAAATSSLAALPVHVLQGILRWAQWSRRKQGEQLMVFGN